ncbi:MAG: rod shape-determining protein MreD [Acidobacteriaceae bacterium]
MAEHTYTSRRELDQYGFHPAVTLLVPVAAVLLQAELPKLWGRFAILDLPLIVVIFFAVSRRSPIAGALTGTFVGLFQDGLTGLPLGINGIAKAIVGYMAASVGFTVDVDNIINRVAMNFVFCLLQSLMLYLMGRFLVADARPLQLWHELLRAVCNTVVAIPIFYLLDTFRHRD